MSEHLKSGVIYGELADYMIALFKKNPEFGDLSMKTLDKVAELHELTLDYKNPNKSEIQAQYLTDITDNIKLSLEKNYINQENMKKIFDFILAMNEADKDYVLSHLDKKKKIWEELSVSINNISVTLDKACGRIPEEPKPKFSIFKAIGDFFNSRNKDTYLAEYKEKEFANKEFNKIMETKKNKF